MEMKWEYSNRNPDCIPCGYIIPLPENIEVMEIIDQYSNFMYEGMSGMPSFLAIMEILRFLKVSEREDIVLKLMIYTAQATVQRNKPQDLKVIKSKGGSKNNGQ